MLMGYIEPVKRYLILS